MQNALVTVDGVGPVDSGQRTTLPAGVQVVTILVGKTRPNQGKIVRFTVTDACGAWPSFVGGGPTAF